MAAVPPLPKSFEDAARHHLAVEDELERVCGSTHFRTSRRSCEFLQYIVKVTLDGRMDSLKERSIGIDLFGRDTSYEPSSDATVRVRANEVRKRLSSYYASSAAPTEVRIDLPTGSYVPRFLPAESIVSLPALAPLRAYPAGQLGSVSRIPAVQALPLAPPLSSIALMRPALLALLVCTLLLRHQLESREEYLRFWDHLLSGRSAMVLALSPEDRLSLASSLYPLVWVAGRYGVDATMAGDSLTGIQQDSRATVQVSYVRPLKTPSAAPSNLSSNAPASAPDTRLRWSFNGQRAPASGYTALVNDKVSGSAASVTSAALLTILPEDTSTLSVQGTDAEAIRRLLEGLTVERNFPPGLAERLDNRHPFQLLLFQDSAREWHRQVYWGGA